MCILIFLSFLFTRNFLIFDNICGSKNWGGPACRVRFKRRQVTLKAAALANTYLQKYTHEQLTYPLRLVYFFIFCCFLLLMSRVMRVTRYFFVWCLFSFSLFPSHHLLFFLYNRTIYNVVYALYIIICIFFFFSISSLEPLLIPG